MAPIDKIALAATLFGFPAAPGLLIPADQVPGPWVDLFEAEHADGPVCQGLFTSCSAGRDWALQRAATVKLALDCTCKSSNRWQKQQQSATSLIASRLSHGGTPPEFRLIWDAHPASWDAARDAIRAVGAAAPGITVVTVDLPYWVELMSRSTPQLFAHIAVTFPQLTSLTVKNAASPLLMPSEFRHLRHLSYTMGPLREAVQLVVLCFYMPQLTSLDLQLYTQFQSANHWLGVMLEFSDEASQTLTTFSTNVALSGLLVHYLQLKAPAVRRLSVGALDGSTIEWAGETWAVRELTVASGDTVTTKYLARLPGVPEGEVLTVKSQGCVVCFEITGAEGFDIRVRQRMSTWRLYVKDIDLLMSPNVPAADQPEALRNAMTQLATLPHPPPIYARDSGWQWTEDVLRVLAQTPANAPSINTDLTVGPLTDTLLTVMLQGSRHIVSLGVAELSLQSDTHAHTPWPWDELTCDTVDLSQMVTKVPHLSAARDVTVRTKEIIIPEELAEIEHCVSKVTDRLRRVKFVPQEDMKVTIRSTQLDLAKQATLCGIARQIRMGDSRCQATLSLIGWPMTRATIEAWRPDAAGVSLLPSYTYKLDLAQCTEWPGTAHEYARVFGDCLPPSCAVLRLPKTAKHTTLGYLLEGMVRPNSAHRLVIELMQ